VHRDVKPENIVLAPHGAMLLDFGIARAVANSEAARVTRSGFTVGTSMYMSPEQAMGEKVDERSDIYSLGCVMYECLAGRPPYDHPLESQVLQLHARAPVPKVRAARSDAPAALAEVIERALAKNAEDRWQSAEEMRQALLAAV
jgi:serine/threonine protein kinase